MRRGPVLASPVVTSNYLIYVSLANLIWMIKDNDSGNIIIYLIEVKIDKDGLICTYSIYE